MYTRIQGRGVEALLKTLYSLLTVRPFEQGERDQSREEGGIRNRKEQSPNRIEKIKGWRVNMSTSKFTLYFIHTV